MWERQWRGLLPYKYYNELLLYSCIKISEFNEEDGPTGKLISFVSPHDKRPSSYNFKTNDVAYGFIFITPDNGVYSPSAYLNGDQITVSYEQGKNATITVQKSFIDMLRKDVKEVYANSIRP